MPKVPDRATDSKRRVTKSPTRDEMDAALGEEYSNEELNRKIQKRFASEQPNYYEG
jgi:hypothetical protein